MSRRYKQATGTIDNTVLPQAVSQALDRYAQGIRVTDVVQAYGGDRGARSRLAQDLALATGTKYKSQLENIRRWMNAESGKGGQTRTPKRQLSTLKKLYTKMVPPRNGRAQVHGKIASKSGGRTVDARDRDIDTENGSGSMDVEGLLDAIQRGDMDDAYEALFSGYASNLYAEEAYDIQLDFF